MPTWLNTKCNTQILLKLWFLIENTDSQNKVEVIACTRVNTKFYVSPIQGAFLIMVKHLRDDRGPLDKQLLQ